MDSMSLEEKKVEIASVVTPAGEDPSEVATIATTTSQTVSGDGSGNKGRVKEGNGGSK